MSDALFYLASIDFTPITKAISRVKESFEKIVEALRKLENRCKQLDPQPIAPKLRLRIAGKTVLVLNKRGAR
jgi:hypothetical protein